jgi:hypothetical protein
MSKSKEVSFRERGGLTLFRRQKSHAMDVRTPRFFSTGNADVDISITAVGDAGNKTEEVKNRNAQECTPRWYSMEVDKEMKDELPWQGTVTGRQGCSGFRGFKSSLKCKRCRCYGLCPRRCGKARVLKEVDGHVPSVISEFFETP